MNTAIRDSSPYGKPFTNDVGTFVRFGVAVGDAEHDRAIKDARAQARAAGLRVIDVAAATRQSYGGWIVELQVTL